VRHPRLFRLLTNPSPRPPTSRCPYLGGVSGCNFIDGAELETTLENYPTKTALQTTLEAYETKDALAETLKDYLKMGDVAPTYVTRNELSGYNFVSYNQLMGILSGYRRV
jgi:hypothetical protein